MPHGKAARKRNWQEASKAKKAARKAEKRAAATPKMKAKPRPLIIPTITEDDLLSFQFSHFGDDTKPDTFFVDPEQALNYRPDVEVVEDDGLGWYSDGVKRTLTDEQIAMFRHTEFEQLLRKRRLQAEDEDEEDDDDDDSYEPPGPDMPIIHTPRPSSPVSDASSLEAELFTNVATQQPKPSKTRTRQKKKNKKSRNNQSENAPSKAPVSPRSRRRKTEVPYDQRNKRKWESYIDNEDPIHGSITHRRQVRELDGQPSDSVAIDYGDDEPAPPKASQPIHVPGRRLISYEDD